MDGRNRVRGSCDEQEHARPCVHDQRALFLLGYDDALARTQTTADETDHPCERRVYSNDTLVVGSSPEYDLERLPLSWLSCDCGSSHQSVPPESRVTKGA